jgi:hypothetical protein
VFLARVVLRKKIAQAELPGIVALPRKAKENKDWETNH